MLPDIRVRQRDYLLEISRALTQELERLEKARKQKKPLEGVVVITRPQNGEVIAVELGTGHGRDRIAGDGRCLLPAACQAGAQAEDDRDGDPPGCGAGCGKKNTHG